MPILSSGRVHVYMCGSHILMFEGVEDFGGQKVSNRKEGRICLVAS